jgi:phosphoribosylanthranilate isomerase
MKPYIGITDFTNYSQVEAMLEVFEKHKAPEQERVLHIGVMMSYKTLNDLPSRWSDVFPPKESIRNIFSSDEVYNCLHYADYDNHPELANSLVKAIGYGGVGLDALQLDMVWPSAHDIRKAVHISRKKIEVILQVSARAMDMVGDDPNSLILRLVDYEGIVDRVLLDMSGGKGIALDSNYLLGYAKRITKALPEMGIVFAGGLGPNTIHLAEPILREFPDASLDAQSKLRPSGSAKDSIDWDMAGQYLIEALALTNKYQRR